VHDSPDRFAHLVRYAIQTYEGLAGSLGSPDRFAHLVRYAIQAYEGVGLNRASSAALPTATGEAGSIPLPCATCSTACPKTCAFLR
jgi:hypothetical protein